MVYKIFVNIYLMSIKFSAINFSGFEPAQKLPYYWDIFESLYFCEFYVSVQIHKNFTTQNFSRHVRSLIN